MTKKVTTARLWKAGDRVVWNRIGTTEQWRARNGKPATIYSDQALSNGTPSNSVRVIFDGEYGTVLALVSNLKEYVEPAKPKTLHDEAREQFELAMTYAEDGAIATAAFMIEQIAQEYRKRANMILAELKG